MGTWGTGIFADDLASDVRTAWRDLIAEGVDPAIATARILADQTPVLSEADEAAKVWVALAVAQWETGRLVPRVCAEAIAAVDRGAGVAAWTDPAERRARQRALARARAQLLSPQPAAKKVARRRRVATPFSAHDLVRYVHDSGTEFLFWVDHNWGDTGGEYSDVDVLEVLGPPLPRPDQAGQLRVLSGSDAFSPAKSVTVRFTLVDADRLPAARAQVVGSTQRAPGRGPHMAAAARDLDDWLRPFLPGGDRLLRRLAPGGPAEAS